MRIFLDAILAFVGASSLTDDEYVIVQAAIADTSDNLENYKILDAILSARELVSNARERLRYYYLAKGFAVGGLDTGKTNILIGASLCS